MHQNSHPSFIVSVSSVDDGNVVEERLHEEHGADQPVDGEETAIPEELPVQPEEKPEGADREVVGQGKEGDLVQSTIGSQVEKAGMFEAVEVQAEAVAVKAATEASPHDPRQLQRLPEEQEGEKLWKIKHT